MARPARHGPGSGSRAGRSVGGSRPAPAAPASRSARNTLRRTARSRPRNAGTPARRPARRGSAPRSADGSSPGGRALANPSAAHDHARRRSAGLLSRSRAIGAALTGCLLGRLPGRRLLRRLPERQPGQLRHLLGQRPDLALQLHDPVPQLRRLRPGLLGLRPPTLRLGTPEPDVVATKIAAIAAHDRARRSPSATRVQHSNPRVSRRASHNDRIYGITEYLRYVSMVAFLPKASRAVNDTSAGVRQPSEFPGRRASGHGRSRRSCTKLSPIAASSEHALAEDSPAAAACWAGRVRDPVRDPARGPRRSAAEPPLTRLSLHAVAGRVHGRSSSRGDRSAIGCDGVRWGSVAG